MDLAAVFASAAAMSGVFLPCVAQWAGVPVLDAGGSILSPGVANSTPCRAQFDRVTQAMRLDADFIESDVRILILSDNLAQPINHAARIIAATGPYAGTWSLRSVELDPAGIGYECRGRLCQ